MKQKKTVIVGASEKTYRYAYMAGERLLAGGYPIVPLGVRSGVVHSLPILRIQDRPAIEDVDTITLYVNPSHQTELYDYLIGLRPRRVIFNPGTENEEFIERLKKAEIEPVIACTLVMLGSGQY